MLFNSTVFLIFFGIFFFLYWYVFNKNLRLQNILIACASFLFYGWWDWRFLSLLFISLLVDYYSGIFIEESNTQKRRKLILVFSLCLNLLLLISFKYFNFFTSSFSDLLLLFGFHADFVTLKIVLPVGISFYTFQSMSYTIDIYRRKLTASRKIIDYAAYISFFPQLVAGPIERAINLLPQFAKPRVFNYKIAVAGVQLILWGFFKKVVIADSCSEIVNFTFQNYTTLNGTQLLAGIMFFAFQIYGDFSGYSAIARGLAKILGFELIVNFDYPYFSRDISEFWRRWHISLSTWFRDYVYFPLGGSRGSKIKTIRNTFIIFLVSGFWHGANWTFIFWGLLNALYFLPLLLLNKNRVHLNIVAVDRNYLTIKEFFSILITFILTCLAWVFFRADNITIAFDYLSRIRNLKLSSIPGLPFHLLFCIMCIYLEWLGRRDNNTLEQIINKYRWVKYPLYFFITALIFTYFTRQQSFIYFQF